MFCEKLLEKNDNATKKFWTVCSHLVKKNLNLLLFFLKEFEERKKEKWKKITPT